MTKEVENNSENKCNIKKNKKQKNKKTKSRTTTGTRRIEKDKLKKI